MIHGQQIRYRHYHGTWPATTWARNRALLSERWEWRNGTVLEHDEDTQMVRILTERGGIVMAAEADVAERLPQNSTG